MFTVGLFVGTGVMGWFDGAFVLTVGLYVGTFDGVFVGCHDGSFVGLELVGGEDVGSDVVSSQ